MSSCCFFFFFLTFTRTCGIEGKITNHVKSTTFTLFSLEAFNKIDEQIVKRRMVIVKARNSVEIYYHWSRWSTFHVVNHPNAYVHYFPILSAESIRAAMGNHISPQQIRLQIFKKYSIRMNSAEIFLENILALFPQLKDEGVAWNNIHKKD